MPDLPKIYIGDGCYATFTGYDFMLTTENGANVTNTIYLEPQHIEALVAFAKKCSDSGDKP